MTDFGSIRTFRQNQSLEIRLNPATCRLETRFGAALPRKDSAFHQNVGDCFAETYSMLRWENCALHWSETLAIACQFRILQPDRMIMRPCPEARQYFAAALDAHDWPGNVALAVFLQPLRSGHGVA
jgi:hypothetical protein